jgi:predicted enzyme related to lactoylglutathione lyase
MNIAPSGPGIVMVLDCADGPRLAEFWSATLNYPITRQVEQFTILRPADDADPRPQLILQQVPEPKGVKNRMHMDLHVGDVEGEVSRLLGIGARKVQEQPNCLGDYCWYLLADPEGNEFCVAPA